MYWLVIAIVLITSLTSIYVTKKYNFKFIGLLKIYAFSTTALIYLASNTLSDILTILPEEQQYLNLKINIISGLMSLAFYILIFNEEIYGVFAKIASDVALFLGVLLLGIAFTEITTNNYFYIMLQKNSLGDWGLEFHIGFVVLLLVNFSLMLYTVNQAMNFQKGLNIPVFTKEVSKYSSQSLIALFTGLGLILFPLIISEFLPVVLMRILSGIAMLSIFTGFYLTIKMIISSPISILYMRRGSSQFLDLNYVGWVFYANLDFGPVIKNKSLNIEDNFQISTSEVMQFGMQSLMFSSNENSFVNGVAITPFLGNKSIISVSLSFILKDESIKDPRLKNRAFSIYSLLMPTAFLTIFSKPIGELRNLQELINKRIEKYPTLQDFASNENLTDITKEILDQMF